jgi:FkbM family methyltransferase
MGLIRDLRALRRSWRIYHGDSENDRALDALYARYVAPGDLVFDIGAHVGHRTASFLRLGARVVAVEPQRLPAMLIRSVWGWRGARVIRAACGETEGTATMRVNSSNPIVSTMSPAFIDASRDAPGWQGQSWDDAVEVPVTTIDRLIATYGAPSFIKIDVEGFEREALAGLTRRTRALSFEFTTIQKEVAAACIRRCEALGYASFNAVIGETHRSQFEAPVSAAEVQAWLAALPLEANSGDIYAT